MRNDTQTAAPATSPAAPSRVKIPAPTMAPTPMNAAWRVVRAVVEPPIALPTEVNVPPRHRAPGPSHPCTDADAVSSHERWTKHLVAGSTASEAVTGSTTQKGRAKGHDQHRRFRDLALEPARRAAAVGALVLVGAALVVAAAGLQGDVGRAIVAPLLLLVVTATAWVAATRKGPTRGAATLAVIVLLGLTVTVVLTAEDHGVTLIVVLALLGGSTLLVRYALRGATGRRSERSRRRGCRCRPPRRASSS